MELVFYYFKLFTKLRYQDWLVIENESELELPLIKYLVVSISYY